MSTGEKAAWFMAGWMFSNTLFLVAAMLYIMHDIAKKIDVLEAPSPERGKEG